MVNQTNSASSSSMNNNKANANKNRVQNTGQPSGKGGAATNSAAASSAAGLSQFTNELFGSGGLQQQQQALLAASMLPSLFGQNQSASNASSFMNTSFLGNINLNDPLIASLATTLLQQQQQESNGNTAAGVSSKPAQKPTPNEAPRGRPAASPNDGARKQQLNQSQQNAQRPAQQRTPQQERRPNPPQRPHQGDNGQRKSLPSQATPNRPHQQTPRPNQIPNNNNQGRPANKPSQQAPLNNQNRAQQQVQNKQQSQQPNNNMNKQPQNVKPNRPANPQQQQQRASSSPGADRANSNNSTNLNDQAAYFAELLQSTNNFMMPQNPNTSNNANSNNALANLFGGGNSSGDPILNMISALANGSSNNSNNKTNSNASDDSTAALVAAYSTLLSQSMTPSNLGLGQAGSGGASSNPLEWFLQIPNLLSSQQSAASPSPTSPSIKSQQNNNANRGPQQRQQPPNASNYNMQRKPNPPGQPNQAKTGNINVPTNNNRQQPPNQARPNAPQQQINRSASGNPQQRNQMPAPNQQQQQKNGSTIRPGPDSNLVELVESKIKLPLKYGWRRETIVKEIHKNGIRGDVIYYSPCSKKLRTFQEIERYLNKTAKEMQQKGIRLTRENFTFSSKLIVGTFLQLKDQFNSMAGSNIYQPINDGASANVSTNDEELDDKIKRELKFDILSEDEIVAKICELNPTFKRKTHAYSSPNETDGGDSRQAVSNRPIPPGANTRPGIQRKPMPLPQAPKPAQAVNQYDYHDDEDEEEEGAVPLNLSKKTGPGGNDLNLNEKIESLKKLKEEQERHFRNQQVQMQVQQMLQQQQHEMELLKLFETNSSQIQLQLELKQQQMNERQREQQRQRNELIEVKRREKTMLLERKTREKWFEYIMTREHQFSSTQTAPSLIHQVVIGEDGVPRQTSKQQALLPFDPIDDMQERYTKPMPEFKPLHIDLLSDRLTALDLPVDASVLSLDWLGDALQVIEFVNTFNEKLVETVKEAEVTSIATSTPGVSALLSELLTNGSSSAFDSIAGLSVLENIESFRCGLENSSEKQRREIALIVQLLLRAAIINTNSSNEEEEEDAEEEEEEEEEEGEDEDEGDQGEEEQEEQEEQEESDEKENGGTEPEEDADGVEDNETSLTETANGLDTSKTKASDPASEALKNKEQDDLYQISKLSELECNDVTYSELLRLYVKRSLNSLKKRRALYTFNVDVTGGLFDRLASFVDGLERHAFEMLAPGMKAALLAFLCDELLNNYNQNWSSEDAGGGPADEDYKGLVTTDLDQAIEELNEFKHEKWQVESKIRALKMEKLNAAVAMNTAVQAVFAKFNQEASAAAAAAVALAAASESKKEGEQTEETKPAEADKLKEREREVEKEREKHQKGIQQLEKKIMQLDKKKLQLKKSYDQSMNKLRSGSHLGQDRYYRHYWHLNNLGGLYVESTHQAGADSMYCNNSAHSAVEPLVSPVVEAKEDVEMKEEAEEEVKKPAEELKVEPMAVDDQEKEDEDQKASENVSVFSLKEEIKREQECQRQRQEDEDKVKVDDQEVNHVASNGQPAAIEKKPPTPKKDPDAQVIEKYGHLIQRFSNDDVFKFTLKLNEPEALELTFRQIEILVRNQIELKQPQEIDAKFLNKPGDLSSKWWLCDTELLFKQLQDCLCKRGYRERFLAKALSKLNEENYNNSQSTASIANTIAAASMTNGAESGGAANTVHGRFVNNLGNKQMYERLDNLFKDLLEVQKKEHEKLAAEKDKKEEEIKAVEEVKPQLEKLFIDKNSSLEHKDQTKLLKQIYALEDRVFNANLQQVPSLNSSLASQHLNTSARQENEDESQKPPLEIAITHLLNLEKRIERRYLKYPFAPRKRLNQAKIASYLKALSKSKQQAATDEANGFKTCSPVKSGMLVSPAMITRELERWRRLVKSAQTCSQLALLVIELNKCIAWDKSIMKVNCQICNSDDNEDQLLLCDNCDSGNHTYCFKPPLDEIPDGDWYCYVCIGKYSKNGERLCYVCGSTATFSPHFSLAEQQSHQHQHYPSTAKNSGKISDLQKCDKCAKTFHYQCMPNARCFKTSSKWTCVTCQTTKSKAKQQQQQQQANSDAKRAAEEQETAKKGKKQTAAAKLAAKTSKATGARKRKLNEDSAVDSPASSSELNNQSVVTGKAKKLKKFTQKPGRKPKATKVQKNGKAGKKTVEENENDSLAESGSDEAEEEDDEGQEEPEEESGQEEPEENEEVGEEEAEEDDDEEEQASGDEEEDEEVGVEGLKSAKSNGHKPKGRPRKHPIKEAPSDAPKKRGRKPLAKTAAKTAATAKTKGGKKAKSNASDSNIDSQDNQSSAAASPAPAPGGKSMNEREVSLCRMLLNDLSRNENAWPFIEQVDEKSYPDYYEVIKEPMSIQTIKNKMKAKQYETKEQFAYDCRLIFDNCEYFNEDHSKIGRAGHNLRAFFETKWMKIFD